jgi:ATP-dependent Zn protease
MFIFAALRAIRIGVNAYIAYILFKLGSKYVLKPKVLKTNLSEIKFQDIVGIDEYKEELQDIIHYLKNRKRFLSFGGNIPKGVLLNGPPGCGKTQLARAVAGETNLPFYFYNASDFV